MSPGSMFLPRPSTDELRRRLPRLLLGLTICGVGIAVMVPTGLGLGPWDVLHQGISQHTGVPIGTVGILVGLVVLLGWMPLRERVGIGTVVNVVWIGVVIDLVLLVMPEVTLTWLRVALTLSGPLLFGLGSGFYIGAGLGPGPRDGLMTGLSARGLRIAPVRTGIEIAALAAGFLLGGTVGVGTLWFALAIGPTVGWTLPRLTVTSRG